MINNNLKLILILLLLLPLISAPLHIDFDDDNSPKLSLTTRPEKVDTLLSLLDTPSSYTGAGSYCLTVKATEDGIEFLACSVGDFSFDDFQASFDLNWTNLDYDKWMYNMSHAPPWDYNQTDTQFNYNMSLAISGEVPIWLNVSDYIYVNSSYPQSVNLTANLTVGDSMRVGTDNLSLFLYSIGSIGYINGSALTIFPNGTKEGYVGTLSKRFGFGYFDVLDVSGSVLFPSDSISGDEVLESSLSIPCETITGADYDVCVGSEVSESDTLGSVVARGKTTNLWIEVDTGGLYTTTIGGNLSVGKELCVGGVCRNNWTNISAGNEIYVSQNKYNFQISIKNGTSENQCLSYNSTLGVFWGTCAGGTSNGTDWNTLINIPVGFSDNIDNDTIYYPSHHIYFNSTNAIFFNVSRFYNKSDIDNAGYITTETDPVWGVEKSSYYYKYAGINISEGGNFEIGNKTTYGGAIDIRGRWS